MKILCDKCGKEIEEDDAWHMVKPCKYGYSHLCEECFASGEEENA